MTERTEPTIKGKNIELARDDLARGLLTSATERLYDRTKMTFDLFTTLI